MNTTPRLRHAVLIAVIAVLSLAFIGPVTPAQATTPKPLPACSYADTKTPLQAYAAGTATLVDTAYTLSKTYSPTDLVSSSTAGINGGFSLRKIVIPDMKAMAAAARSAGVKIGIDSGFRTWSGQASLFNRYVGYLGYAAALLRVARPGHSEHELGTTFDLVDYRGAYAWVGANGWKYGFVLSYPSRKTAVTCYQSEPWHFRWEGRARASLIHASGLTIREWLWKNVASSHF